MIMKNAITAMTLLTTLMMWSATVFAAGPIAERQGMQQNRIKQGVKSGAVTRQELNHLQRDQRQIRMVKQRAWQDGHLSRHEQARVARMQNQASHKIHRMKTNAVSHPSRGYAYQPVRHQAYPRHQTVRPPCPQPVHRRQVITYPSGFLGVAVAQPGWSLALSTTLD
jgi:hypothetical protein